MKMIITATTDRQYMGHVFDSKDNPVVLGEGIKVFIERTMPLPNGMRFISSSYIIDAKEV